MTDAIVIEEYDAASPLGRIRARHSGWVAIGSGAVVALATHAAMSLLGGAIGLGLAPSMIDGRVGPGGPAVGAAIWWLIATIASVFAGAFVAGHMADSARRNIAALHGLATWGLSTVAAMTAMTAALGGLAVGGSFGAGAAAAAAAPVAADRVFGEGARSPFGALGPTIDSEVARVDRPRRAGRADDNAPESERPVSYRAGRDVLMRNWMDSVVSGRTADSADRNDAVRALADRNGMSEEDARAVVGRVEARASEARVRAEEAAKTAARGAAVASLWGFFGLILAAGAGCVGGVSGARCNARDLTAKRAASGGTTGTFDGGSPATT